MNALSLSRAGRGGGAAERPAFPVRGLIAHRGDGAEFPQNTIPAFLSAIRKGAEMVELDERRCKTGEIVVMHDPVVDRVAGGARGNVADMTIAELKALDVGAPMGERFRGTRIPTLEEALEVFPAEGMLLNLHCKIEDAAPEAAGIIRRQGRENQVVFMMDTLPGVLRRRCAARRRTGSRRGD